MVFSQSKHNQQLDDTRFKDQLNISQMVFRIVIDQKLKNSKYIILLFIMIKTCLKLIYIKIRRYEMKVNCDLSFYAFKPCIWIQSHPTFRIIKNTKVLQTQSSQRTNNVCYNNMLYESTSFSLLLYEYKTTSVECIALS